MNTTEAQRKEMRTEIGAWSSSARAIVTEMIDDIDELVAALRRLADADKAAKGPCMTADGACPCAQCEAGRLEVSGE